jgi:lysophospholipase L1-like esterase
MKQAILTAPDSITYGYQSTDGNGYRKQLFNHLSGDGNTVNLIGSVQSGTMADNKNEGHSGATIDQISSFASASLPERPNVVLLHAGTIDMNLPSDPAGAPTRLGSLIDKILATCPDALVLVAQIVPSGNAATQANIVTYNAAIPGVVAARTAQGSKVMVVGMYSRLLTPDDYVDDLHPNDGGYAIMGDTWAYAIAYADAALGWISPPVAGTVSSS